MDAVLQKTLLYDFYGDLLTDHQQRIYEEVILNDYSESEVAKDEGISRQSIHDMIRRCRRQLENYEEKLHMVERFLSIRAKAAAIRQLAASDTQQSTEYGERSTGYDERLEMIGRIASEIIEEL